MITMRLSRRSLLSASSALLGLSAVRCVTDGDEKADATDTGNSPTTPEVEDDALVPITSNNDHYITSCCGTPTLDPATWSAALRDRTGGGDVLLGALDLASLEALGGRDKEHTLECISASPRYQAIGNAVWTGLPLLEVFDAMGITVPAAAIELYLEGADGYTTAVPVTDLDRPIWIVWRMNGDRLPDAHGGVVRLLVPGRYGMKNVKWLTALHFIDQPYIGFWEQMGWSNDCTVKPAAYIAQPLIEEVPAGDFWVLGTAFAGEDPVTAVEISLDDGATWAPVEITYPGGPSVWTQWRFAWTATTGVHTLRVRATTQSGATTGHPDGSDSLSGYDGGMSLNVTVI